MSSSQQETRVKLYGTRFCPYCIRARLLLKQKEVEYEEINVGFDQVLWAEMTALSGRDTVPQIIINGQAIGGYSDMAALDSSGELDRLLGRA